MPQARSVLARGLVASGAYEKGFNELETLRTENPGTALAAQAHDLQVSAATAAASTDVDTAGRLFDRLKSQARTPAEEALLQKQKADAYFDARYYLEAEDEYLQLATNYRDSMWVPYAWFRIADCEWQMARWLNLGVERYQQADKSFQDYLKVYPDGSNAPEAKARMVEVHRHEAEKYRQIAEFYITAEQRPWAAVNYLNYLVSDYADTPQAAWARQELEQHQRRPGRRRWPAGRGSSRCSAWPPSRKASRRMSDPRPNHVSMGRRGAALLLGLAALALAGCGYGTHSLYRGDIHTVYVEFFGNDTYRRQLEVSLTHYVVGEIKLRTPLDFAPGQAGRQRAERQDRRADVSTVVKNAKDVVLLQRARVRVHFRWRDRLTGRDIVPEQDVEMTGRTASPGGGGHLRDRARAARHVRPRPEGSRPPNCGKHGAKLVTWTCSRSRSPHFGEKS